jgi:hypothetical protein
MARKRAPEDDYICMRCQCACTPSGDKHISGGDSAHTSCGKPPSPVLRADWDAMMKADLVAVRRVISRPPWREPKGPDEGVLTTK